MKNFTVPREEKIQPTQGIQMTEIARQRIVTVDGTELICMLNHKMYAISIVIDP